MTARKPAVDAAGGRPVRGVEGRPPARGGKPIGELDTQIAAHALVDGLTLVAHNTRHFTQVSGLKLEGWMVEPPAAAKPKRKTT